MPLFLEGRSSFGVIEGPVRIFGKHVVDDQSECHIQLYPQLGFIGQYRYTSLNHIKTKLPSKVASFMFIFDMQLE